MSLRVRLSPVSLLLLPLLFYTLPVLCPALHLQCCHRRGLKNHCMATNNPLTLSRERLHTREITRQTDLSMIVAAQRVYHKLLETASDDLERVTPQPPESLHAEATRDKRRSPRPETSNEKSCPRPEAPSERFCSPAETLVEKPCSRPERASEVFRSRSETSSPSRGPLEQVADGDFSQATWVNRTSVQIWRVEVRGQDVFGNYDDIELALRSRGT